MSYLINDDLPRAVRNQLLKHEQDIFHAPLSHAWQGYASDPRQE